MDTPRPGPRVCDVEIVDALARLSLGAKRAGYPIRLAILAPELEELIEFMGLTEALCKPNEEDEMATKTSRQLYVNIAVGDLDRSVEFFTKLGFAFDPRFTDETATCMIVGDDAYVMLLVEGRFRDFTKKQLADPGTQTEAILAFSAESREQVDELADRALESGGSAANDPMDMGFMYSRSFQDPDGHLWELVWMDEAAAG